MSIYKCQNPNCNRKHESIDEIAFCSYCGSKVIPIQVKPRGLSVLFNDSSLWHKSVFNNAPAIISHEYWRLQQECQNNSPFSVILQIRDVMEVLLKFEVLVVCAYATYAKMDDFNKSIGCQIARPTMTMGTWLNIADSIVKHFMESTDHLPDSLFRPLKSIQKHYNFNGFVNWRNETIGHGALGFADDQRYIIDIQSKIGQLNDLFEIISDDLSKQRMYVLSDPCLYLIGHETALNIQAFDQDEVRLQVDDRDFSLSPYILIRDRGLYFFDTQSGKTTKQLNYTLGLRRTERIDFFIHLSEDIINSGMNTELSISDQFLTDKEEAFLNQFGTNAFFVKPKHLTEWVRSMLNKHNKGVFMLLMARGMGKSTFSEKLNSLYPNHLNIDTNVDVRTYHLSRTQLRHNNDLERTVENLWSISGDGSLWTGYKRMIDFRIEGCKPKEAFAQFLNQARRFTEQNASRGQSQILMVLDGLDEIAENTIWEYIPDGSMLDEGVYLLLTSRDPEVERNLPSKIIERLSSLSVTEKYRVAAESKQNQAFLQIYMNQLFKNKIVQLDGKQRNLLTTIADNRVSDLQLLCKMVIGGMAVTELPDNSRLIQAYIDMLKKRYGPRRFCDIVRVISVFCTFGQGDSLSLEEIAKLCNNDLVSFELLGILNDLSGILKVQRSYGLDIRTFCYKGENIYCLANPDYAKALIDYLPVSEDQKYVMSIFRSTVMLLTLQEVFTDIEKTKAEFTKCIQQYKRQRMSSNELKLTLRHIQLERFASYTENLCYLRVKTSGQWDRLKQDYALWQAGMTCNSKVGKEWLGFLESAESLTIEELKKFIFDIRDKLCLGITEFELIPANTQPFKLHFVPFQQAVYGFLAGGKDYGLPHKNPSYDGLKFLYHFILSSFSRRITSILSGSFSNYDASSQAVSQVLDLQRPISRSSLGVLQEIP